MLIELGTDRLSQAKRAVQSTVIGILGFMGANGISAQVKAEPLIQSTGISRTINPDVGINIDATTKAVMDRLAQLSVDLSQVVPDLTEPLGGTLTKAWIGEDGLLRIADKKLILKQTLDGRFKPSNLLQQAYDSGNEDLLRYGILGGDPLPNLNEYSAQPVIYGRIIYILSSLSEYFQANYYISQSANFGGFNVYNISDDQGLTFALLEIAEGPNLGSITLANITPQIINLNLIPQDLVLSQEQIGIGGVEPIPTPKVEPQPTPTVLVFPRYPQIPLPTPDLSYTKRPEVKGDQECVSKTNSALDLLKQKSLSIEYSMVIKYLGIIECVDGGGNHARVTENPPRAVFDREIRAQDIFAYAAAIVHESCHVWQEMRFRQLREKDPSIHPLLPGITSGKEAETECYNIEYQTLKRLGDHPENLKLFRESVLKDFGIIIYNP